MNTTSPVMTVTDELLEELELCESCDCGFDMDRTDVKTVLTELRRLRAENAELAKDAERYRWLSKRLVGASFDWDGEGMTALAFEMPDSITVSANCDAVIDIAMAAQ